MRTFELKVQRYLQEMKLIEQGEKILVAVSGGMDSMALLQYVYNQRQQLEIEVFVVHVDHMLRGEESHKDRLFVEAYCKERGITIFSRAISIPTIIEHESGNLQSVCRRERYLYFEEIMKKHGINKLVTAHHADDQLESLLISITKGATVNGMQGIKPIRKLPAGGVIIRPFLAVTKDEIRLYLMEQGISYREDASNAKDDTTSCEDQHSAWLHASVPSLLACSNESDTSCKSVSARRIYNDPDADRRSREGHCILRKALFLFLSLLKECVSCHGSISLPSDGRLSFLALCVSSLVIAHL